MIKRGVGEGENVIYLFVTDEGWMTQHVGPLRKELIELFGTNILPTPFTKRASEEYVRDEIKRLNPSSLVEVCEVPQSS